MSSEQSRLDNHPNIHVSPRPDGSACRALVFSVECLGQIPIYALRMSSLASEFGGAARALRCGRPRAGRRDRRSSAPGARSARRSAPCSLRCGCVARARTPAARSQARAPSTARRAARASARSSARGRSRTSAARRRTWCRQAARGAPSGAETGRRHSRAARPNCARAAGMKAPILRLSSTERRGNSRRLSGTCAMPVSMILCGGCRAEIDALHRHRAARSRAAARR